MAPAALGLRPARSIAEPASARASLGLAVVERDQRLAGGDPGAQPAVPGLVHRGARGAEERPGQPRVAEVDHDDPGQPGEPAGQAAEPLGRTRPAGARRTSGGCHRSRAACRRAAATAARSCTAGRSPPRPPPSGRSSWPTPGRPAAHRPSAAGSGRRRRRTRRPLPRRSRPAGAAACRAAHRHRARRPGRARRRPAGTRRGRRRRAGRPPAAAGAGPGASPAADGSRPAGAVIAAAQARPRVAQVLRVGPVHGAQVVQVLGARPLLAALVGRQQRLAEPRRLAALGLIPGPDLGYHVGERDPQRQPVGPDHAGAVGRAALGR